MKFWAYLSCGNADIRNQTASENIETAARGGQAADVTCSVEFGGVQGEFEKSGKGGREARTGKKKKKACDTNEKLHGETTKDRKCADVENTILSMFLSLSVFFGCLSD